MCIQVEGEKRKKITPYADRSVSLLIKRRPLNPTFDCGLSLSSSYCLINSGKRGSERDGDRNRCGDLVYVGKYGDKKKETVVYVHVYVCRRPKTG